MADEAAEIKVRLVLDDAATAAAERYSQAAKKTHEATDNINKHLKQSHLETVKFGAAFAELAEKASHFTSDVAKGVITGELALKGMELGYEKVAHAAHKAHEIGEEAFHAAVNEAREIKEIGASLSLSAPGVSLERIKTAATMVQGELEEMGMQAGVAAGDVQAAFNSIAARSHKSVEELETLTQQMTIAGKVIPGGIGALSSGFTMFEQGMIRARNPVVMLIAQTGVLKGNAHDVAKQLMHMAPEKQLELGEKAIAAMAAKAKSLPLSFDALKQSMKDMREQIMEDMGRPILQATKNIMGDVRTFFLGHREEVLEVAESVGGSIGRMITKAGGFVKDFYSFFADHETEIGESLRYAWDYAGTIMHDILDEGRAFAATLEDTWKASKAAWSGIKDGVEYVLRDLAQVLEDAGLAAKIPGKDGGGPTHTDISREARIHKERAEKLARDPTIDGTDPTIEMNKEITEFYRIMREAGANQAELNSYYEGFVQQHKAAVDQFEGVAKLAETNSVMAGREIIRMYNQANAIHDAAAMDYIVKFAAGNQKIMDGIIHAGIAIEGNMTAFAGRFDKFGAPVTAGILEKQAKSLKDAGKKVEANFNGGQTFNIKQDFRDQDPDRIAMIFRNDILSRAVSKLSAATGLPLGY